MLETHIPVLLLDSDNFFCTLNLGLRISDLEKWRVWNRVMQKEYGQIKKKMKVRVFFSYRDFVGKLCWKTTHILEAGVPPACPQGLCQQPHHHQPSNAAHFHCCLVTFSLCAGTIPLCNTFAAALSFLHPCSEAAFAYSSPNKYLEWGLLYCVTLWYSLSLQSP